MFSGSNYVATDYYRQQGQQFSWTSSYDYNRRVATVYWNMTTISSDNARPPTYNVCHGTQTLQLRVGWGSWWTPVATSASYWSSNGTVYRGFTDSGSWLDRNRNGRTFFDTNGNYTGIRRWVNILGTKWASGSFEVPFNADGTASFEVYGNFAWYNTTRRTFQIRFYLQSIAPAKYTIKYDINKQDKKLINLTGEIANGTKEYNKAYTISSVKPDSSSYEFVGWDVDRNATVGKYQAGSQLDANINQDTTLYAIWKPKEFEYEYVFNGGRTEEDLDEIKELIVIGKDNSQARIKSLRKNVFKIPFGTKIVNPNKLKRDGYHSLGWRYDGVTYSGSDHIELEYLYNVKVYAQFEATSDNTIELYDSITGKLIGIVQNITYADDFDLTNVPNEKLPYISGDFRVGNYLEKGYRLEGWSFKQQKPFTIADTVSDIYIKPGLPINKEDYLNNKYWGLTKSTVDYFKPYTKNEPSDVVYNGCTIDGKKEYRKVIKLYSVLTYISTSYVYTNNAWKLTLPYVYTNGQWKISMSNVRTADKWKI